MRNERSNRPLLKKVPWPKGQFIPASGSMYEFATAYRDAARIVAGDQDIGDVQSIPVLSLYRHAVELSIKSILVDASTVCPWICTTEVLNRLHDLDRQLPDLVRAAGEYERELSPQFTALIAAWHEDDMKGMKARYPLNKAGKYKSLQCSDHFDLRAFVAECESALEELDLIFKLVSESVYESILDEIHGGGTPQSSE